MTGVLRQCLRSRIQLLLVVVAVFVANLCETQLEEALKSPSTYALGYRINHAFWELEGRFDFGRPEWVSPWTIIGYAGAYFALLPALLLGSALALWRRESVQAFRVFVVGIAFTYLLALPFYVWLPVPERWAFPPANTTLLSDVLSTRLIECIRPISGLDNCFPSMHVALTVLIVLMGYWCNFRLRHSILFLGVTIVLATFFLGIHWLPDIAVGAAAGSLGFSGAVHLDRRWFPDATPRGGFRARRRTSLPFTRLSPRKLVFISYRRERGSRLARVTQMELERRGISCFLDVDDLGAEHFDERLLLEIEKAPNFVLVLAPGSLDRCRRHEDWLRREIVHAFEHQRNIIPLLVDEFQFPPETDMPPGLETLPRLNGVTYSHEYFSASFDKLEGFLRKK